MKNRMKLLLVLIAFTLLGYGSTLAVEIEQTFRAERFTRGNTNLVPVQPIDEAAWVWLDGVGVASGEYTPFVRFRCDFESIAGKPLRFDVSADARFVLMLDGEVIARGPHKGCPQRWYYETYSVKGLSAGSHRMEAVVFDPGCKGALSILSSGRNGFVLKADGAYDSRLTTGKANWLAAEVKSIRYGRVTDPDTMTGAETISVGTGFLDAIPSADAWRKVDVVRHPVGTSEYGLHTPGWALFPTERPDPMEQVRTCGSVRAVQTGIAYTNGLYAASDASNPAVVDAHALLKDARPLMVAPHSRLRILWDLEDYYCAFPILEATGGKAARIRWAWAESLYGIAYKGHIYLNKGSRDEFTGKRVDRSMDDTFLCDGRGKARFTTPWWRSGRWVEISVETGDAPLTLTRLAIAETRYPLEPEMRFACDDPSIADVQRICVRGMQNCLHEMFMDCPYFEQQMYPGDTRVEMLILNAMSGDDRPLRYAAGIFDYARRDDGMVPMNFPSRNVQDSATYSMCWAMMFGDYVLWHGTNAWLKARLPGLRQTMSAIAMCENADGLVEGLPGWSFMDWVPEWDTFGNAPEGRRGLSALNNLQYIAALQSAAKTEAALGDAAMAAYWSAKAHRTGEAVVRHFWSEERGMLADTVRKDCFSEHAQCLALLADILPKDKAEAAFKGLLEAADLARTTVYFSHYLFETYLKFGRADLFLKRLDLWRGYVKDGLKTPLEAPGVRARSDCHAWGAHPLYHLITGVAGVRPAADGCAKVLVAPQPGGLKSIKATAPTPKGNVYVDLRFNDGRATGTVVLPPGLTGEFEWKGVRTPLKSGMNEFTDPNRTKPLAAIPRTNQGLFHSWDPAPNWWAKRHEAKLQELKSYNGKIDIVMIGDSITHNWEGARGPGSGFGAKRLDEFRRTYSAVCLGYGGDTTRNVLWRLENGELDGYEAKCVMLMIGTNNGGEDSPADIAAGIREILDVIAEKQPNAVTILLPVFPRGEKPDNWYRKRHAKINAIIKGFADGKRVLWCDFTDRLLEPDGSISKEMMPDFLHPRSAGYDIWADAVAPLFRRILEND